MAKGGWRDHLGSPYVLLASFAFLWILQMHAAFWLVWVSFVPCLLLLKQAKSTRQGLIFAAACAAIISIGGLYWFAYFKLFLLALALLAWTAFLCLAFLFARWLEMELGNAGVLAWPAAWTILMAGASLTPLGGFPFELALLSPDMAPLIWLVKGVGITFLIVLGNAAAASWLLEKKPAMRHLLIAVAVIVILCKGYSALPETRGEPATVALLQGNFDRPWEWRVQHAGEVFDAYLRMSREAAAGGPTAIVWPEYAITLDIFGQAGRLEQLRSLAVETGATLIIGMLRDGGEADINSALLVTPDGAVRTYDTPTPSPFGGNVARGGSTPADALVAMGRARAGVSICFDETSASGMRQLHGAGATVFVSMANNWVFRSSIGLKVTSQFIRLRAAENRAWAVRSANTGITQAVDPRGKVVAALPVREQATLLATIYT